MSESSTATATEPIRVEFEPNTTSATVGGTVNLDGSGHGGSYVVRAEKGQFLNLELKSAPETTAMFTLITWGNGQGGEKGQTSLTIPETGDYVISVGVNQMATTTKSGGFLLTISITDVECGA